jgi:hypothetical protein
MWFEFKVHEDATGFGVANCYEQFPAMLRSGTI